MLSYDSKRLKVPTKIYIDSDINTTGRQCVLLFVRLVLLLLGSNLLAAGKCNAGGMKGFNLRINGTAIIE